METSRNGKTGAGRLEYGARTLRWRQFRTRFWPCAAACKRIGIYLLIHEPFRMKAQKTIMVEMMDQRDWRVPDWVVLPGGNLGKHVGFRQGAA